MRYFFDRDGNYAGSSMQGWEILLLLLFPVALIIFLVFLPFYVFHKYSSREEDKKYEEEHPEILKVDSYITCWYPWHRYSVAYTLANPIAPATRQATAATYCCFFIGLSSIIILSMMTVFPAPRILYRCILSQFDAVEVLFLPDGSGASQP